MLLWALHRPIVEQVVLHPTGIGVAVVGILLAPLLAEPFGLIVALSGIGACLVALLGFALVRANARNVAV